MANKFYFLILLVASVVFSSCKKCYECSDGSEVVRLCDYNRKKINSDISIYETRGYTCVKD